MLGLHETITLDTDEHIIASFRSGTVSAINKLFPCGLAVFALFFFMFPLFYAGLSGALFFFIALGVDALIMLHIALRWYGSISLLTERRLFIITRLGLLRKKVNEVVLENINEISYDTKGISQTVFGYGTINCSLFTTSGSCCIPEVAKPQDVLNLISKYTALSKKISQVSNRDTTLLMGMRESGSGPKVDTLKKKKGADPANWR